MDNNLTIVEMQNAAALTAQNLTMDKVQAYEAVGMLKMGEFQRKLLTVSTIKILAEFKESKRYKDLDIADSSGNRQRVSSWEDFCNALGMSRQKVDLDIQNLTVFGEDFLEYGQRIGLGYRDLRKLRQTPEAERMEIIGTAKQDNTSKEDLLELIEDLSSKHSREKNELESRLQDLQETAEAKDKVIADKNKKVDELAEKLAKKQTGAKEPKAEDVGSDLLMMLSSLEVSIRSQVSRLKELFDQLNAHREAHGINHTAKMVGTLNQIILDCETLRENYALPTEAPTDDVPEWLADAGNTEN